jgi:AraC-like DNA-binding protein
MKKDILTEYYRPLLEQNNFRSISCPDKFGPAGRCWEISDTVGSGYYWVYARQDLFDIKIHDFYFHEDFCLDVEIPECISIQRYDSISGEELNPYRRLSAGDIETIVGGNQRYRALIHKRIPVHSVGIEILPAYYEGFLKKEYPDDYFSLPAAFQSIDQASDFPAMSKLLFEIENYHGDGMAAALFYEAKVTEAIALVVDAWKRQSQKQIRPLSTGDLAGLNNVVSYIADHYAFDIPLERLANIACMSESKLKTCFKRQFGCSVTQYIQGRRMSQAEHLLINTDFTMGQIAQMIGYTTSSRFAELFRKSTGILPIEYRKIARGH